MWSMTSSPGLSIKEAREAKGWTQQALARAARVTRLTVSYWENGRRTPRPKRWPTLARLLDCTVVLEHGAMCLERKAA
jgi:transcriptional regulator with XRE-family HTH domain